MPKKLEKEVEATALAVQEVIEQGEEDEKADVIVYFTKGKDKPKKFKTKVEAAVKKNIGIHWQGAKKQFTFHYLPYPKFLEQTKYEVTTAKAYTLNAGKPLAAWRFFYCGEEFPLSTKIRFHDTKRAENFHCLLGPKINVDFSLSKNSLHCSFVGEVEQLHLVSEQGRLHFYFAGFCIFSIAPQNSYNIGIEKLQKKSDTRVEINITEKKEHGIKVFGEQLSLECLGWMVDAVYHEDSSLAQIQGQESEYYLCGKTTGVTAIHNRYGDIFQDVTLPFSDPYAPLFGGQQIVHKEENSVLLQSTAGLPLGHIKGDRLERIMQGESCFYFLAPEKDSMYKFLLGIAVAGVYS